MQINIQDEISSVKAKIVDLENQLITAEGEERIAIGNRIVAKENQLSSLFNKLPTNESGKIPLCSSKSHGIYLNLIDNCIIVMYNELNTHVVIICFAKSLMGFPVTFFFSFTIYIWRLHCKI